MRIRRGTWSPGEGHSRIHRSSRTWRNSAVTTQGDKSTWRLWIGGRSHLHGLISRLEIKGGHLWAHVPHGQGVVVRGVHPLGFRVYATQLHYVIPQEHLKYNIDHIKDAANTLYPNEVGKISSSSTWIFSGEEIMSFSALTSGKEDISEWIRSSRLWYLKKNKGTCNKMCLNDLNIQHSLLYVEDNRSAVDNEVWQLPGYSHGLLPLSILVLPMRGGSGGVADLGGPIQRLLSRLCCHLIDIHAVFLNAARYSSSQVRANLKHSWLAITFHLDDPLRGGWVLRCIGRDGDTSVDYVQAALLHGAERGLIGDQFV